MLLSNVGSYILAKILGDYIDGIDSKSLSISVASGSVSLSNLTLRKDALKGFQLPVAIKEGTLGNISLTIPWTRINSEPSIVRISDVFLLVSPRDPVEEMAHSTEYETKLKKLRYASLVGLDKPPAEQEKLKASELKKENKPKGYFEGLSTTVINNLQIFVNNIHIRYEDPLSTPEIPFAIGISLGSVHMQSTDSEWNPLNMSETKPIIQKLLYKVLNVRDFSIYVETNCNFLQFQSTPEFTKIMTSYVSQVPSHNFLLAPLSCSVQVTLNPDKLDFSEPRLNVQFVLDELKLSITSSQLRCVTGLSTWFSTFDKRVEYFKYNAPKVRPTEDPRAWWTFTIRALLDKANSNKSTWSWDFFRKYLQDRKNYVILFKKWYKLGEAKMSEEDQNSFHKIQRDYPYEVLIPWRKISHAELRIEEKSKKTGWFSWATSSTEMSDADFERGISEILSPAGNNNETAEPEYAIPKNYVNSHARFISKGGSLMLIEEKIPGNSSSNNLLNMLGISFSQLRAEFSMREGASTSMFISLQSFEARDYCTLPTVSVGLPLLTVDREKVASLTTIVPKPHESALAHIPQEMRDFSSSMLFIEYHSRPLHRQDIDIIINVTTQPVLVTFSPVFSEHFTKFFSNENEASNLGLPSYDFEVIREQTQSKLKYALETKAKVLISVDVYSPTLILSSDVSVFSASPSSSRNKSCMVIDLGRITIKSDLSDQIQSEELMSNSAKLDEKSFYDSYELSIRSIFVLVTSDYYNWRKTIGTEVSDVYSTIIPPFDVNLNFKLRSIPVITIPQFIIDGKINALHVHLATSRVRDILNVLKAVQQRSTNSSSSSTITSSSTVTPEKNQKVIVSGDSTTPIPKSKNIQFRFEIPEIVVSLEHSHDLTSKAKSSIPGETILCLKGTNVEFESNSTDTKIHFELNSAYVKDLYKSPEPSRRRSSGGNDVSGDKRHKIRRTGTKKRKSLLKREFYVINSAKIPDDDGDETAIKEDLEDSTDIGLISITYCSYPKGSSLFNGADSEIIVIFNELHCLLHQNYLARLLNTLNDLSSLLSSMFTPSTSTNSLSSSAISSAYATHVPLLPGKGTSSNNTNTITNSYRDSDSDGLCSDDDSDFMSADEGDDDLWSLIEKEEQLKLTTTAVKVEIQIRIVSLKMVKENFHPFFHAKLTGADMSVDLKRCNKLIANGQVSNVQILSCNPSSLWPSILTFNQPESRAVKIDSDSEAKDALLSFRYETFIEDLPDYPGYASLIKLEMPSSGKIIYLQETISELGAFFSEFTGSLKKVEQQKPHQTQIQQTQQIISKMKLVVGIANQYIIVPASKHSKNYTEIDLGLLSLQNEFSELYNDEDDDNSDSVKKICGFMDSYAISISKVGINTFIESSKGLLKNSFLSDACFSVKFTRPLLEIPEFQNKFVQMDVSVSLQNNFTINLSNHQILHFLRTLKHNIMTTPAPSKTPEEDVPLIQESERLPDQAQNIETPQSNASKTDRFDLVPKMKFRFNFPRMEFHLREEHHRKPKEKKKSEDQSDSKVKPKKRKTSEKKVRKTEKTLILFLTIDNIHLKCFMYEKKMCAGLSIRDLVISAPHPDSISSQPIPSTENFPTITPETTAPSIPKIKATTSSATLSPTTMTTTSTTSIPTITTSTTSPEKITTTMPSTPETTSPVSTTSISSAPIITATISPETMATPSTTSSDNSPAATMAISPPTPTLSTTTTSTATTISPKSTTTTSLFPTSLVPPTEYPKSTKMETPSVLGASSFKLVNLFSLAPRYSDAILVAYTSRTNKSDIKVEIDAPKILPTPYSTQKFLEFFNRLTAAQEYKEFFASTTETTTASDTKKTSKIASSSAIVLSMKSPLLIILGNYDSPESEVGAFVLELGDFTALYCSMSISTPVIITSTSTTSTTVPTTITTTSTTTTETIHAKISSEKNDFDSIVEIKATLVNMQAMNCKYNVDEHNKPPNLQRSHDKELQHHDRRKTIVHGRNIIMPTTITFSQKQQSSSTFKHDTLSANISPINCFFTYEEILAFLGVYGQWISLANNSTQVSDSPQNLEAKRDPYQGKTYQQINCEISSISLQLSDDMIDSKKQLAIPVMSIQTGSFSYELTNQSNNYTNYKDKRVESDTNLSGKEIQLLSFNRQQGVFEPLVEPWEVDISMKSTQTFSDENNAEDQEALPSSLGIVVTTTTTMTTTTTTTNVADTLETYSKSISSVNPTITDIRISSKSQLNVNFAISILDVVFTSTKFITEVSNLWQSINTKPGTVQFNRTRISSETSYPLMLRNECGYTVNYFWQNKSGDILEDNDIAEPYINSNEKKPVLISNSSSSEKLEDHKLYIQLCSPEATPSIITSRSSRNLQAPLSNSRSSSLPHLPKYDFLYDPILVTWTKVGTTIKLLTPTMRFVVEISQEGGSVMVTVRGDCFFVNNTDVQLSVRIFPYNTSAKKLTFELDPFQKFGLSVFSCTAGIEKIKVRPKKSSPQAHKWGIWQRNNENSSKSDNYITCQPPRKNPDSLKKFTCAVLENQRLFDGLLDYGITFSVPLEIKNLLPCPLYYMVSKFSQKKDRYEHELETLQQEQTEESLKVIPATSESHPARITDLPTVDNDLSVIFALDSQSKYISKPINIKLLDFKHNHAETQFDIIDKEENHKWTLTLDVTLQDNKILQCSVFCAYWLMNCSGIPLKYKSSHHSKKIVMGQKGKEEHDSEEPFFYSKPKVCISYPPYTAWSKAYEIALGNDGEMVVSQKDDEFLFSVQVVTAPGKYWRTLLVRFYPKFTLVNCCPYALYYKPRYQEIHDKISPNRQKAVLQWPMDSDFMLFLSPADRKNSARWTDGIKVTNLKNFQIRIPQIEQIEPEIAPPKTPRGKLLETDTVSVTEDTLEGDSPRKSSSKLKRSSKKSKRNSETSLNLDLPIGSKSLDKSSSRSQPSSPRDSSVLRTSTPVKLRPTKKDHLKVDDHKDSKNTDNNNNNNTAKNSKKEVATSHFNVDLKIYKFLRYIIISEAHEPLFKIRNDSDYYLYVKQFFSSKSMLVKVCTSSLEGKIGTSGNESPTITEIEPNSEIDWYFEDPQQEQLEASIYFQKENFKSEEKQINFAEVKECGKINTDNGYIYLTLKIGGKQSTQSLTQPRTITKVLMCEFSAEKRKKREKMPGAGSIQGTSKKMSKSNLTLNPAFFTLSIELSSVGISVIDRRQELLFAYFEELNILTKTSKIHQELNVELKKFQIDNQLYATPRRIVFYSPPVEGHKFLHLYLVQNLTLTGAQCYHYFGLLLQQIDIAVDQIFLAHLLDYNDYLMGAFQLISGKDESTAILKITTPKKRRTSDTKTIPDKKGSHTSEPVHLDIKSEKIRENLLSSSEFFYVEFFQLNSMLLHLTFTPAAPDPDAEIGKTAIDKVLTIGGLVSEVEDAPIKVPALCAENLLNTQEQLTQKIFAHYKNYILSQVFLLIGSADFIGDPVGLVSNLGSGVYSFFYEPAKGIVSGPKEFGIGFAKGTKALLSNSIEGIFSTASKLTSGVTKAATILSMDKDYQHERAVAKRKKAKHAGQGLVMGLRDFGTGVAKGVTGVVTQPIKGAKKEGAIGALKGVGKGLAELVIRPAVGTIDLVSRTAQGIAATPKYLDSDVHKKFAIRSPRYFDSSRVLQPYCREKAEGQELLWNLSGGRYKKESHFFLTLSETSVHSSVLLSTKSVFALSKPLLKLNESSWEVDWSLPFTHIQPSLEIQESKKLLSVGIYDTNWKSDVKLITTDRADEYVAALHDIKKFLTPYAKTSLDFQVTPKHIQDSVKNFEEWKFEGGTLDFLKFEGISTLIPIWKSMNFKIKNGVLSSSDESISLELETRLTYCFADEREDRDHVFVLLQNNSVHIFSARDYRERQIWMDLCFKNGAQPPSTKSYLSTSISQKKIDRKFKSREKISDMYSGLKKSFRPSRSPLSSQLQQLQQQPQQQQPQQQLATLLEEALKQNPDAAGQTVADFISQIKQSNINE